MRVLIVEDEPDIRECVRQLLVEENYAVDTASEGKEGFNKALDYDYDLIVLDVLMPQMNGWEVLEEIRKHKSTPVLMLTALDQVDDKVKGLNLGSDDYLAKPFDMTEFLARVRAIIRRSAGLSSSQISHGEIKVNTSNRKVHFQGEEIDLTAREYALVEYMIMHQGSVVTRTELYDHLFDETDDTLSNVLDVHVCNVRKKLYSDFIKTRRGHGYILENESC